MGLFIVMLGVLIMSHSLQLFSAPISDEEILRPHTCDTVEELIHCARQQNIFFDNQQMLGLECADRWFKSGDPFTVEFTVWADGNWSCFHDYAYRLMPIFPGQFQKGYYASRGGIDKPAHFYHLPTNTARDFILHR
ncbi:MAG: hypothetical protein U1B30_09560 [Pseudomonadota bacterium]|nr:hypothetical protein [Pseudomonadota bacterium]